MDPSAGLLAALPVGVIGVDKDQVVTWSNPRAESLLAKPGLVGKKVLDALPGELYESVDKQIASKGTAKLRSIVVNNLTMMVGPMGDGAIVVISPAGIPSHLGHELKTPLTSIMAYTEAVEGLVEDPESKRFLGVVIEETKRMMKMIDDQVAKWRAG
jgi:nitrogen-specific signal transduction histidine kinase